MSVNAVDTDLLFETDQKLTRIVDWMIRTDSASHNLPFVMLTWGAVLGLLNNHQGGGTLSPYAVEDWLGKANIWIRLYDEDSVGGDRETD